MIDLNSVTAIAACLLAIPTVSGYFRIAISETNVAGHMAASSVCFAAAYALRTFYWDVVRAVTPTDAWAAWTNAVGGLAVNVIFNLLFCYGAWRSLHAIHGTIPDDERSEWNLFTAWLYPPWRVALWFRFLGREARARRQRSRIDRAMRRIKRGGK